LNNIKSDLRSNYLKLRSEITSQQIDNFSIEIVNRCLELNLWNKSVYHLFMASEQNKEIDTALLLSVLQGKDKQIVIPKIVDDYELEHYLLADQTPLKRSHWGIPEPQSGIKINSNQIDVVFVPLLIFDLQGHRIGYGKGYYDRFLAKCRKETIKVGLSYFDPIERIEDIQPHDIPMNFGITKDRIYKFSFD
jgi:5-formyltetrahydrofolate cyclo-ligase